MDGKRATLGPRLATAKWHKSSFSGDQGACVEIARLSGDAIAVRNSNRPDDGVIMFTTTELAAWIKACKSGEFDDLMSS